MNSLSEQGSFNGQSFRFVDSLQGARGEAGDTSPPKRRPRANVLLPKSFNAMEFLPSEIQSQPCSLEDLPSASDSQSSSPELLLSETESLSPTQKALMANMRRADAARWLVGQLTLKSAYDEGADGGEGYPLQAEILSRVMGQKHYAAVVRALVKGGAIKRTRGYQSGVESKRYRLATRYDGDETLWVPLVEPGIIERIEQERIRMEVEEKSRWLPVHHALADHQERFLTIDAKEAYRILDSIPRNRRTPVQRGLIASIRRGEHRLTVGKRTRRVSNSITNLKSEIREAIRIDGQRAGFVDISCAQPALLASLIENPSVAVKLFERPPLGLDALRTYIPSRFFPLFFPLSPPYGDCSGSDFQNYRTAVCDDSFYDQLAQHVGCDRDTVKELLMEDVLAKRGWYDRTDFNVECPFSDLFPSVHAIIRDYNRGEYCLLHLLTRTESWLVIENVAPALIAAGIPTITLHDAIFCREDDVARVAQTFRQVSDDLGIRLTFKDSNGVYHWPSREPSTHQAKPSQAA